MATIMDSIITSSDHCEGEDTNQDLTETPPSCTDIKFEELASKLQPTKQSLTETSPSYTDENPVRIASKLHLKAFIQPLFFESALLFIRKAYNQVAAKSNSKVPSTKVSIDRKLLIEMATSSFLGQMGMHIWPSYVKNRQNLTVVSPYGDKRKERHKAMSQYRVERDEWEKGIRAVRPVIPTYERGLLYLGKGRLEIEKSVKAYMRRLVELGCVGEVQEV